MQIFTFINTRRELESKWKYVPPAEADAVYFEPIPCTLLHVICILYIFAHPYFPQMYTYPRCNNENWKLKRKKRYLLSGFPYARQRCTIRVAE